MLCVIARRNDEAIHNLMSRRIVIIVFFFLTLTVSAQEMRVVDSLLDALSAQEGREKVKTMMELSKVFSDYSFDECVDWGEKAIMEAKAQGYTDLEADANYALGEHYGYHIDLDLSYAYLKTAFDLHESIRDEEKAFEDIWRQAYFEHVYGNVDTALCMYEKVRDEEGMVVVNCN